jgi:hypothetical protein
MNTTLSTLGIIHTAISVLALIFAFTGLFTEGRINPRTNTGKYYIVSTVLACLTSFGLSRAGGFNPGHALGIFILLLLGVVYLAMRTQSFGRFSAHVETFCMTCTLFISLIPGINETLTHVPPAHPIASGIDSPIIKNSILVLLIIFIAGVILQLRRIKVPAASTKEVIN